MAKSSIELYVEQRLRQLSNEKFTNWDIIASSMQPEGKKEYARILICQIDASIQELELVLAKMQEDGKSK